jgi:hypothetical protein
MIHHAYAKGLSSQSTTVPSKPGLPSRPFPAQEPAAEAPDLAVQQERAERFGHRLGHNFSVSASPIQRVKIKPEELQQGKLKLKKAGLEKGDRFGLGPVNMGQHDTVKRHKGMEGHEYADMVASMRRGITSLRADLNDQGGVQGDDKTYAKTSMDEWARRTYNVVGTGGKYKANYTEDVTRALYDNWRADSTGAENDRKEHEIGLFRTLSQLQLGKEDQGVDVYDQKTKRPPHEVLHHEDIDSALGKFAYRMIPNRGRKQDDFGMSRFSLNMEVEQSSDYAKRMYDQVSKDPENINQAKIMGPSSIGKRVDDGVVYLNRPDVEQAQTVASNLADEVGPSVRSIPPGMEQIRPGVSYAEYMPNSSTSHGENRGEIIANAVRERMQEDASPNKKSLVSDLVGKHTLEKGYDPKQPSRIRPQLFLPEKVRRVRQATGYGNLLAEKMNQRRRGMGYEDDE